MISQPASSLPQPRGAEGVIRKARALRDRVGTGLHDRAAVSLYEEAARIAAISVKFERRVGRDWDLIADRILAGRLCGFPIMLAGLVGTLWLTIRGANVPSALLYDGLFRVHDWAAELMNAIGAPWWLTGFLIHGVYRGLAWVIAVMLPPMAIFFPIFTLLEDVGYLPRVAFNLDRLFRWCGAHGKQSLTMGMGLGCNAAGVTACRIIDSPRERLIAILTNNFMLCNGRWPTVIMLATVFIAAAFPPAWSSVVATGSVALIMLLGVVVTFLVSRLLSRTVLRGEASHFYLELPPYRRPNVLRVIHRSILDRTMFVLSRACVTAAPAGGLIWILGNVNVGGESLMAHLTAMLNPVAAIIGLDGVILLAYIIALPANEIVVPTIIMGYMAQSQMLELDNPAELAAVFHANGWTMVTAVCMMLFCLLHYPCATTSWTIYRETGSWKWTLLANAMPLTLAILACGAVAQVAKLVM
jgi:ferrous iron transport protein B